MESNYVSVSLKYVNKACFKTNWTVSSFAKTSKNEPNLRILRIKLKLICWIMCKLKNLSKRIMLYRFLKCNVIKIQNVSHITLREWLKSSSFDTEPVFRNDPDCGIHRFHEVGPRSFDQIFFSSSFPSRSPSRLDRPGRKKRAIFWKVGWKPRLQNVPRLR